MGSQIVADRGATICSHGVVISVREWFVALPLLATLACGDGGGPIGSEPAFPRGTTILDLTYCRPGGRDLNLDLYLPTTPERAPAILFLHGGGWITGDKRESGWFDAVRERLLDQGFIVASANYRLAPGNAWPAHIEDAKCAVRFLRAERETYGIDPDHIGVWGTSAGAHLAALVGVTNAGAGFEGTGGQAAESSRVQAVVDLYGPADLTDGEGWPDGHLAVLRLVFGTSNLDDPVLAEASPVFHATSDDPPFLILHGERDGLVPIRQSERLFAALAASGAAVEFVPVENARHGLEPLGGEIRPSKEEITGRIVEFFDAELR